jgi:hypothetical protein
LLIVLSALCLAAAGVLGIARSLCDRTTCGGASWLTVGLAVAGVAVFLFGFVTALSRREDDGEADR